MKLKDMLLMALSNLWKRKVRTLLTVVGVVIGTCAIVVMISLGIGMQQATDAALAQMGDLTLITIYNWSGNADLDPLDDTMLENFRSLEEVTAVMPIYSTYIYSGGGQFTLESGKYTYDGQIYGVNMKDLEAFGYSVTEGSLPDGTEQEHVFLMGSQAAYSFYDAKRNKHVYQYAGDDPFVDAMEDKFTITINKSYENTTTKRPKEYKISCLGVLTEDYNKNPYPVYAIFMDINFLKELEKEYNSFNNIKQDRNKVDTGYEQVVVKCADMDDVAEVEEYIKSFGYETNSMESIRKPIQEQARSQQMMLGGLAAISLLVAAIGIANTMIMSIYERTREIGVMKVLGCLVRDIRATFLMEAGLIGLMGGIIGSGLSYLFSFLINTFSTQNAQNNYLGLTGGIGGTSVIPFWLVLGATAFATLIGLVSGFYPANRAVKISALSAIKQD